MKEMSDKEYPELIKWPGFLVDGEDVSKEQAAEILLRTDSCLFSTNDRAWDKNVREILSYPTELEYPPQGHSMRDLFRAEDQWREKFSIISLEYISNAQIGSAYVYGPHGWCGWNGEIGCHYGNIGKWPSVERVRDEWRLVAKEFPYLKLRCQLLDREMSEEGGRAIVEYIIDSGSVIVVHPGDLLMPKHRGARRSTWDCWGSERGCSSMQLMIARDICLAKKG